MLAIVGESGSGKTVTAKTILGLLPETATTVGAVVLRSRDGGTESDVVALAKTQLREMRGTRRRHGVPGAVDRAEPGLHRRLADRGGPAGPRQAVARREARAKAIEILGRVGIPDPEKRVDYYPHQFSGGQKQRVVIAMALVLDPGLIVADEPTTALDVTVQAEILDLLRRCRDEFGAAIVLITHNMGVVADLADRVAVMYQGEVVEEADVSTLFANPQDAYTKQLLAAVPHIGQGSARTRERAAARAPRSGRSGSPSSRRDGPPDRSTRGGSASPGSSPSTA